MESELKCILKIGEEKSLSRITYGYMHQLLYVSEAPQKYEDAYKKTIGEIHGNLQIRSII